MPYASQAQERFFHTDTAKKAGITGAEVKEFDTASKGKKLPKHVAKSKDGLHKAMGHVGTGGY
jgi:hypothetical protein